MSKKLILVRGLPGSGKSTLAKQLVDGIHNAFHYEADMYFLQSDGTYQYDPQKISDAHKWCQHETKLDLDAGLSVVVSNTFTTTRELRQYFEIASEVGIVPSVILLQNNYGSIHSVPDDAMRRMKDRFQYDISELIQTYTERIEVL